MNTTKILGEAVGIQSQRVIDHTETQTNIGLTSAIIIGQFKRGRVDRPMTIHNGNIRGQLGYEPNNPYYNAVQDCLDTGVPSVQVLRVGGIDNGNVPIGCDGATNNIFINMFSFLDSSDEITVGVNERVETFINKQDFDNRFNDVFAHPSLEISDVYHFYAGAGINYRVSITVSSSDFDTPVQIDNGGEFNPTFMFEGKTISFCLAMGT